jgi:hypothetical protein
MADLAIEGQRSIVPGVKSQYLGPIGFGFASGILIPSPRSPSPPLPPVVFATPRVADGLDDESHAWQGRPG